MNAYKRCHKTRLKDKKTNDRVVHEIAPAAPYRKRTDVSPVLVAGVTEGHTMSRMNFLEISTESGHLG